MASSAVIHNTARQDGQRLSSLPFPVEIHIKIIEDLIDNDDSGPEPVIRQLSALALACSCLYELVLPYQFKSLSFRSAERKFREQASDPWDAPNIIEFCRLLNKGDVRAQALSHNIQECILTNWGPYYECVPPPSKEHCYSEILHSLTMMPNLRSLTLRDCGLATEAVEVLAKLKKLKTLKLDWFAFPDPNVKERLKALHSLYLKSLFCSGEEITCRYLRTRGLEKLHTRSWPLARHILSLRPTIQLTHLRIDNRISKPELLWEYLIATPSLTHLCLPFIRRSGYDYQLADYDFSSLRAPPSFLPNLRFLLCPLHFAPSFSSAPMTCLEIKGMGYIDPNSDFLQTEVTSCLNGAVFTSVEELTLGVSLPHSVLITSFPRIKKFNGARSSSARRPPRSWCLHHRRTCDCE